MKLLAWLVALVSFLACAQGAWAQSCPQPDTRRSQARFVIDQFIRNGRAPAGADCAYSWATGIDLGATGLTDEVLQFFRTASDVQRTAYNQRRDNGVPGSEQFLAHEIALRTKLIAAALESNDAAQLRPVVAQNLSYLVAAMALKGQWNDVAETLGRHSPTNINKDALEVWLQALWSCAQWDGKKLNVCAQSNRQLCKERILVFLESLDDMGKRELPPQTRADIKGLRLVTSKSGCLR